LHVPLNLFSYIPLFHFHTYDPRLSPQNHIPPWLQCFLLFFSLQATHFCLIILPIMCIKFTNLKWTKTMYPIKPWTHLLHIDGLKKMNHPPT
jgi:hypothetical protein